MSSAPGPPGSGTLLNSAAVALGEKTLESPVLGRRAPRVSDGVFLRVCRSTCVFQASQGKSSPESHASQGGLGTRGAHPASEKMLSVRGVTHSCFLMQPSSLSPATAP